MASTVSTIFVDQFSANLAMALQQTDSRLGGAVRFEPMSSEYAFFDKIGITTPVVRGTRHGDTPLIEVPHSRRRITTVDYEWATLLDRQDQLKMLADPKGAYVSAAVAAFNRQKDSVIEAAFDADVTTGRASDGTASYDSDMTVAVDHANDSTACGMTIAKLLEAKKLLDANEVPDDGRFISITAEQLQNLLGTTQVTSADYNTVKALVSGEVNSFLGFKFLHTELVGADSSDYRECWFWHRDAMLIGVGQDIQARADERQDKSYAWQAYVSMSLGAIRMDEEAVGKILCSE
jgi:hypothetical protein